MQSTVYFSAYTTDASIKYILHLAARMPKQFSMTLFALKKR